MGKKAQEIPVSRFGGAIGFSPFRWARQPGRLARPVVVKNHSRCSVSVSAFTGEYRCCCTLGRVFSPKRAAWLVQVKAPTAKYEYVHVLPLPTIKMDKAQGGMCARPAAAHPCRPRIHELGGLGRSFEMGCPIKSTRGPSKCKCLLGMVRTPSLCGRPSHDFD